MTDDSIESALRISHREQASITLIAEAMKAQQAAGELAATLSADIKTSKDEFQDAVSRLELRLDQVPGAMAQAATGEMKNDLLEAVGVLNERIEQGAKRAFGKALDAVKSDLAEVSAQAKAIELPGSNKRQIATLAIVAAACFGFGALSTFAVNRIFPPAPGPELQRQMQAGSDITRVWPSLKESTRQELIALFQKR